MDYHAPFMPRPKLSSTAVALYVVAALLAANLIATLARSDAPAILPAALAHHLQNLAIVQGIKSNELLKDSYDNLAKTYQGLGDYKKAYSYKQEEMKLKDTIYKEQSAKNYAEMEARYQNEKKQKEILLLQQNNKIANIQLLNQRLIKYFLLAGIAIILLVALFIYLQPLIAAFLGIVFQDEVLTARTMLGGALIFAGVYFALNLPRPPGLRRAAPAS